MSAPTSWSRAATSRRRRSATGATARLLDTNVLIDITSGRGEAATATFEEQVARGHPLFISTVSLFEFRLGAEGSYRRESRLAGLGRFMLIVKALPFEAADAEASAKIKRDLRERGLMIGAYDLLIAGQAVARNLSLVTGNLKEFSRIPELAIQAWA